MSPPPAARVVSLLLIFFCMRVLCSCPSTCSSRLAAIRWRRSASTSSCSGIAQRPLRNWRRCVFVCVCVCACMLWGGGGRHAAGCEENGACILPYVRVRGSLVDVAGDHRRAEVLQREARLHRIDDWCPPLVFPLPLEFMQCHTVTDSPGGRGCGAMHCSRAWCVVLKTGVALEGRRSAHGPYSPNCTA